MLGVVGFWWGIFVVMLHLGDMKDGWLVFLGERVVFVFLW
ncbi:DUF2626 family protein [Bacillus altitudinis]